MDALTLECLGGGDVASVVHRRDVVEEVLITR